MRITLTIDDDVLTLVRQFAEARSLSLGRAISELVRQGLQAPVAFKLVNGMVVVDVPPDSPVATSEQVRNLESELE